MSIIKTIVEWHNGRIWFESTEGKGTTFFIEIPKSSLRRYATLTGVSQPLTIGLLTTAMDYVFWQTKLNNVSVEETDAFYTSTPFQYFFQKSDQSLILKADSPRFTILAVSDHYLKITHKQRSDLLNRGLFEVFPGSEANASEQYSVYSSFQRVIANGHPDELPVFSYEIFLPETNKRETLYWSNRNDPLLNDQEEVAYIINTTNNVTHAVLIEQAREESKALRELLDREKTLNQQLQLSQSELQVFNNELESSIARRTEDLVRSEAKYRTLIEQAPIAIATFMGPDFTIESFNDKVLQFWGRTAEQVAGLPLFTALPEAGNQGYEELLKQVYTTGKRFTANELPVTLKRNGKLEDTRINFIYDAIHDATGAISGVMVLCIEVTEQYNDKASLQATNEQLQLAKQAAQLGTFDLNISTGQLVCDEHCKELFGINTNASTIAYSTDFVQGIHPDDKERVLQALNDAHNLEVKKGSYDVEYKTIGFQDQQIRWVRAIGKVLFNTGGQPLRLIGSVLDITEQKKDDERKNNFISMVSHELKTPLTSINGYVQILQSKFNKSNEAVTRNLLDKAAVQVKKMTTMINGFLNVARLESGKIFINLKRFDLAELLKEIEEESIATIFTHKVVFEPVLPTFVLADRDKIEQVINNFISNAVKYSPGGSTIQVACVTVHAQAHISIKDEGMGIAPEDQSKLFDRFYRVQSDYTNTIAGFGIGLYLCAEIIQRHEGQIGVNSESGKGSTFYFTLPVDK